MNFNKGLISNAYVPIAEHIASKHGLRITHGGTKFFTTEKMIRIPEPIPGLEKKFHDAILGGVLHEARHIFESDFDVLEKSKIDPKYNLLNLVEDLRTELNTIEEYPGGRQILKRLMDYMKSNYRLKNERLELKKQNGEEIKDEDKIRPLKYLGMAIDDYIKGIAPDLTVYSPEYVAIVSQMTDLIEEIKDIGVGLDKTEKSKELSVKIYQRLSEILQKKGEDDDGETFEIPQSALEDSENDEEGDGSKGDNKNDKENEDNKNNENDKDSETEEDSNGGADSSDDDDETDSDESNDDETDSDESDDDETNGNGSDSDETNGDKTKNIQTDNDEDDISQNNTDVPPDADIPDATNSPFSDPDFWEDLEEDIESSNPLEDKITMVNEQMQEEIVEEIVTNQRHIPHPDILEQDIYLHEPPTAGSLLNVRNSYNEDMAKIGPQIGILKGKLLPLLLSEQRGGFLPEQEEGEVDEAALVALRSGSKKVYRKKIPRKKVNTALTFLGDVSGSMTGEKILQLKRALIACAETCEALHVPDEILAFTTSGSYYNELKIPENREIYNRFEPIKHIVIKDFNETLNDTRWRLALIRSGNCNCDPEAIWWAGKRLSHRREKRKILFVMHDGWPNLQSANNDRMYSEIKYIVNLFDKSGIEVYGVGILTDSPMQFYPPGRCLIIWDDKSIATSIYKLLEEKLREKR